jgi:hypothetical protein
MSVAPSRRQGRWFSLKVDVLVAIPTRLKHLVIQRPNDRLSNSVLLERRPFQGSLIEDASQAAKHISFIDLVSPNIWAIYTLNVLA